jgi:hypothetical protein
MTGATHHLAQLNISKLKAPLDDASMGEFVAFLDPVNAYAEASPGFVWRLKADGGLPSSYLASPFADPMTISNLTVWTDLESLRVFAYETVHRYFLQSRRKWFERPQGRQVVLWWLPEGHLPTLDGAVQKLQFLEETGPTPAAFTFQDAFDSFGHPIPRA